ncbi:HD-GYP domain-containing protein [Streptomyces sp. BI20]|uniref:HD-GYP domain-containing protein n=1 Tax=Streptomyces sp. BI20 TaxID=3403460 RepID=UPI003C706BBE
MRVLPAPARLCVLTVLGAALAVLTAAPPALADPHHRRTALLLAALYLACELPRRRPRPDTGAPAFGPFYPVLLAACLLLPPAAAALVAVPGALVTRPERGPRAVRRLWHAATQALAAACAAGAFALTAGPDLCDPPRFPAVLLPAACAALAFCLVLTLLDGAVLIAAEGRSPHAALLAPLPAALAPHLTHGLAGLMMAVLWRSPYGVPAALAVLLPMGISCRLFAQYQRERAAHHAGIRALVQAVDLKDRYTRGHGERVGQAAALIADELGMPEERRELVRIAGILHDIGKIGVPTRLLRKEGPLTPEERRVIELHPEYGHEIVRGIGFLDEARTAILHHHEKVDGTGYPYGLAGEEIPELARVVCVADCFDAMTSHRSYSRGRPVPAALAELRRCAGTQFDPRVVEALVTAVQRHGWHPVVTADTAADSPHGCLPDGCPAAPTPHPEGTLDGALDSEVPSQGRRAPAEPPARARRRRRPSRSAGGPGPGPA